MESTISYTISNLEKRMETFIKLREVLSRMRVASPGSTFDKDNFDKNEHEIELLMTEIIKAKEKLIKLNEQKTVVTYQVFISAPAFDHWFAETQGHCFELLVGKNGIPSFSCKDVSQRSKDKVANFRVGVTFLDPEKIRIIGQRLLNEKYKTYNYILNNCQTFTSDLLGEILYNNERTNRFLVGCGVGGSETNIGRNRLLFDRLNGLVADTRSKLFLAFSCMIMLIGLYVYC